MPELPEVETARRGIAPLLEGHTLHGLIVRQARLRWPIPPGLGRRLRGQRVSAVERRAKYLLLRLDRGTLILHLGMSGSLRVLPADAPAGPHDHVDLLFDRYCLRLRDPRRFGALLWVRGDPERHALLRDLGPEPLEAAFDGAHLHRLAQSRHTAIKNLIMDARVVTGVGNIYASEALFRAGIHPQRACRRIALARYERLAQAIKAVLAEAIEQGGTTLRDFQQADGQSGYFSVRLQVYGRADEPCPRCGAAIRCQRIGQRSSYYCPRCQR